MTPHRFTCLIPAYNEAARIGGVLAAVAGHTALTEVIVIDDGSTDATATVARTFGVRVLATSGNLGKTAALAHGLRHVATSHVLLLDADLLGLTSDDISALIAPVSESRAIASISLRGNAPGLWRLIGLDYISGERALPCDLLQPHLVTCDTLPRFGFEVFLNQLLIASDQPVAVVSLPGVASPSKAAKRGVWGGISADALMMRDIFRTVTLREILGQIVRLKQSHRVPHRSAV